jgi:GxxExxY protein
MNTDIERLNALTEKIIGCAFIVSNQLGCGYLEKVYENALAHELRKAGLNVRQQYPIIIRYDGIVVGEYCADLVVENIVLIELKVAKSFDEIHFAQCLNYLKATDLPICLLMNFGHTRVEIKRFAGRNSDVNRKPS